VSLAMSYWVEGRLIGSGANQELQNVVVEAATQPTITSAMDYVLGPYTTRAQAEAIANGGSNNPGAGKYHGAGGLTGPGGIVGGKGSLLGSLGLPTLPPDLAVRAVKLVLGLALIVVGFVGLVKDDPVVQLVAGAAKTAGKVAAL